MVSADRRDQQSASQRTRAKGTGSGRIATPQELSDFRSIISSLEHFDTSQISTELSDDARNRRGMNEALARAIDSLNGTSENATWKKDLEKNAYKVLRRHSHVLWPLPCLDVPAPTQLLSDEIHTSAEKITPMHENAAHISSLNGSEHGQIWMAVQAALYRVLSLLSWTFPSHLPTSSLQKEVERLTANAKGYKPEALRSVLSYYNWNIDRLPRSHTIAWRDVLAVALSTENPALIGAAEKALSLLQELYNAQPEEPKLEKRTWSLHSNAPLLERTRMLCEARNNCAKYQLKDYMNESIDTDHILSPMESDTSVVPKGNDMLLSDPREQSWLSGVDELYASLMWEGESDDVSSDSDVNELPSDLYFPDESPQSSDSDSESEGEDEDSGPSDSPSSSSSSSNSSGSSTESSESETGTDSEISDEEEVLSTHKRQSSSPLPVPKRVRTDRPA